MVLNPGCTLELLGVFFFLIVPLGLTPGQLNVNPCVARAERQVCLHVSSVPKLGSPGQGPLVRRPLLSSTWASFPKNTTSHLL